MTVAVLFGSHAGNTFEIAVKGCWLGEAEQVGRFLKRLRSTCRNESLGLLVCQRADGRVVEFRTIVAEGVIAQVVEQSRRDCLHSSRCLLHSDSRPLFWLYS